MGISVLLSTPVTVLIAICFVREPHSPPVRHVAKLRDYLALLRLRSARLALSSVAMTGFSIGISSSVFVFYYTIVKAIPMATVNIVLGFLFAVTISSIPVWTKIGNRIGKHRALTLGCTISCLYMAAMWLMPPGNLTYMICLFAIGGFAGASADLFPRAMMADVSDEDHLITGMDRTAMLYALLALVTKLGQATAIGVVFVMLDLFGFKASLGLHNSARALTGVLLLGSLVPSLLHVGAALFAWRYPLTAERHAAIRTELDHQRPGYDPEAKPRTICHDTLGAVLAAPRG
jgi:GPH family glycoside/pentoside/hexuronide:cation symporter